MRAALVMLVVVAAAHRADAKGCHDRSYVVGFEQCSGFGEWSRDRHYPRIWIDLGYFDHHFPSHRFVLGNQALVSREPHTLATQSTGGLLRLNVGLGHLVYVGGEFEAGGANVESGLVGKPPSDNESGAFHAFAGIHTDVARFAFAGELATGLRGEDYIVCASQDVKCQELEQAQGHFDLEARARVDIFVDVHASLGVMFAQSLTQASNHELMLLLGIHVRAMDGM